MKTCLRTVMFALALCFACTVSHAQLPDGSVAPDFTLTDLDGTTHNLYTYLGQGKTVVLDFSATWCGPCWNYHQSGALEDLYNLHGPNGTDDFRVIYIEADTDTEEACLYGPGPDCTGGTQGNWVAGTPYPIIEMPDNSTYNDFAISFFPTIYTVCPDGFIYQSGQIDGATHYTWKQSCDFDATFVSSSGMQCYEDQSGTVDIDIVAGAGNISYAWNSGHNTQDLANVHPGTYSVVATDANGVERQLTDIVVDGPLSELITSVSNQTDVTCHGDSDGTIDVTTEGGTPGYSFNWNNGATTEDVMNLPGGSFTLIVTDDNGCFKEITAEIVDPDAVEGEIEMSEENCGRNDATITAIGSGGTGALTYSYGPSTNQTGVFTNVSAGDYDFVITDGNNCSWTLPITVDEIPNPDLEIFPADELDCQNSLIQLAASASVGPEFSYVWTTPDGNIVSGEYSLSPEVDAPGTYQLVVVNNTNGCFSESSIVVEGTSDLPSVVIEDPAAFSCTTTEVVIDGSNSSSGNDYSYEWSTDDGEIISGGSTAMVTVGSAGTYTLVVTNTTTQCSSTSSIEVEEDADIPLAEIASAPVIDCDNQLVDLDGSSSSQGDEYEYEWSTNDGMISSAADDQATVSAAGTYTLTVINTNTGCSNEVSIEVVDESVHVEAQWVFVADDLTIIIDNLTTGNPNEIEWDMGNGDIVSGDISDYVYAEAGTYDVCLTAGNGCGNDIYCLRVIVNNELGDKANFDIAPQGDGTGLGAQSFDGGSDAIVTTGQANVYPNPTSGDFTVELQDRSMVKNISIFDLNGLAVQNVDVNKELHRVVVKSDDIANGTYFVRIHLEQEVLIKQVTIVK